MNAQVLDPRMLSFAERAQVLKLAHAVQDAAKALSDAVFRGIVSEIDAASSAVDAANTAFQEALDRRLARWAPEPSSSLVVIGEIPGMPAQR